MSMQVAPLIYLTGFMGSGKSTVAPLLAGRLGYEICELDEAIVERAGRSIPEIFEQEGEAEFRRIERELLEETSKLVNAIVSLGGGAVTFTTNLEVVRTTGILVYLDVPTEILVERLHGAEGRPLLRDDAGSILSRRQLRQKVARMMRERRPYYEKADVIVDAGEQTPEETVDDVMNAIRGCSARATNG